VTANAQFIYDEWGDIVPFSLTDKYKNQINIDEIHTHFLPKYDNDSLSKAYNNGRSLPELGNTFVGGFPIEKKIDVKKEGRIINIDTGTIWIVTIESSSAECIGVTIKNLNIPAGAALSFIQGYNYSIECEPDVYVQEQITSEIKEKGLREWVYSSKMIIEYFEPNNLHENNNIIINQVNYGFYGVKKKDIGR
jgi:hypothetical protein